MKERPILFSGPMVRAILEGRKTQTRRVVKPQPFMVLSAADWHSRAMSGVDPYGCRPMGSHVLEEMGSTCPHGTVGDRLWVREAFCQKFEDGRPVYNADGNLDCTCCYYRADGVDVRLCDGDGFSVFTKSGLEASPWRPSIHMPRWASRITLEITGVRVERLQEISEKDANAEGLDFDGEHAEWFNEGEHLTAAGAPMSGERYAFMRLWESINGLKSWDANPWVWVIEFRRMQT